MTRIRFVEERGITLVEVLLAVTLLASVIGVSATSLASFYVTMDMQEQRIEAIHACRAVAGELREKRGDFQIGSDGFDWNAYLAWIHEGNEAGWPAFLRQGEKGEELTGHALSVTCFNMDGAPANAGDNPLEIYVTSTWRDRKNRSLSAQLVTVLTNR